jgi:hypothetical protein
MASPTASLPIRPSIYEKLHEDETRGEDKEIPIKLSIAGAVLSMPSTGQWELGIF